MGQKAESSTMRFTIFPRLTFPPEHKSRGGRFIGGFTAASPETQPVRCIGTIWIRTTALTGSTALFRAEIEERGTFAAIRSDGRISVCFRIPEKSRTLSVSPQLAPTGRTPIFAGATRPDEERLPGIRKPSECADAFINRKVYAKPPMPIRKRPHKRGHSLYCSRHRIKNWRFFRSKQQQMLLRYFRCKYKKRFRYIQQVSGNGTIFDIFISVCLIRRRLPASPHGPRPAPVHSGQTPAVHARLPFPAACVGGVRIALSDARREADPVRRPHKRERVVRPTSDPPWKTA